MLLKDLEGIRAFALALPRSHNLIAKHGTEEAYLEHCRNYIEVNDVMPVDDLKIVDEWLLGLKSDRLNAIAGTDLLWACVVGARCPAPGCLSNPEQLWETLRNAFLEPPAESKSTDPNGVCISPDQLCQILAAVAVPDDNIGWYHTLGNFDVQERDGLIVLNAQGDNTYALPLSLDKLRENLASVGITLTDEKLDPSRDPRWYPIGEAGEEDGMMLTVLVDGKRVLGTYEQGHTWGWIDGRGNWIYPTHYLKE